jgi:hypothetical protein
LTPATSLKDYSATHSKFKRGRKMNLKHLIPITALLGAAVLGTARADDHVSGRRITHIGCHHVDGTCYVSLDGAAFGAVENCAHTPAGGNQFRFDSADTVNGRRTYASLLAAFLSQRPVSVLIRGCSSQGVPSLVYFDIAQ